MTHTCRFCQAPLGVVFADLGMSPVANDYVAADHASAMEPFYPLCAYVCERCFLVQLADVQRAESMFSNEYAYFSSYSDSWLAHARDYAQATIVREGLGPQSLVVEIASNDGYLLQYFKAAGVPVLGIEPTANTARVAREERGIPTEVVFFGQQTAAELQQRGIQADVIVANNVLAHVPDLNDFVAGFPLLLKPNGVATFEFPHLLQLIEQSQFDTIYHEHFSYLSFETTRRIFAAHRLRVFHVEELATHGGSLRVHVCRQENSSRLTTQQVADLAAREVAFGLADITTYRRFSESVVATKCDVLAFLVQAKREKKVVVGYGAPAKGNTLLNYCGIKPDLLQFTVDRSPHKAGKLLPGSRIPILQTEAIRSARPDYVMILPWNLREEVMSQMGFIADWGGRFVTPIPHVKVY